MIGNDQSESVYLHDIPLDKAWQVFIRALKASDLWRPLGAEDVPLESALGRVTAEPIWARISSPHYHAAAMDGYALKAADTDGASDRAPVVLKVGTQALYVDTGEAMPAWADAVAPVEVVEPIGETEGGRATQAIQLRAALAPWTHVRPMGEDMVATELVLPAGHELQPVDLGAIAGSGYSTVQVQRRPRVAIIPTGSELVPPGTAIKPGEIIEYNSLVLAAQVETWGGAPSRFPIVTDDFETIRATVAKAADQHDLVLVNAGSSAGSEDFTARVVRSLGELLVHGVAIRPGHPVVLGMIRRSHGAKNGDPSAEDSGLADSPPEGLEPTSTSVPIIGVPGYPVSTALTGEIFVEPLLSRWLGRPAKEPRTIQATLTRKVHSSLGDDEYLRVTVGKVGDRLIAAPLSRGAGVISSLVRADGIVVIPSGVQGHQAGETVEVRLYRPLSDIDRTILILGSHDLTIDLLAQFLAHRGARLSSANLGSLGGLIALRRGEAHLAGSHLLDIESGEYNLAYIKEYIPDIPVVVVALVARQQGLIVAQGNPKGIKGLQDLVRQGITFINRQRGAGTRLLLDYHLQQANIQTDAIAGYHREEYTHLAVAAAIASQRADCALGIRAAAAALKLDFIPLFDERYDLVIPSEHYHSPKLTPLLELLTDPEFRAAVDALPGYDTSPMGKVIAELT
jgi:putative molybdopterin biosynthesis protein